MGQWVVSFSYLQCSQPSGVPAEPRGGTAKSPGRDGTARVMSHDVKRIRSEVYDFSLASTGGPSAGTIVPYSQSGPHLPGRSQPRPPPKTDGLGGWEHRLSLCLG